MIASSCGKLVFCHIHMQTSVLKTVCGPDETETDTPLNNSKSPEDKYH